MSAAIMSAAIMSAAMSVEGPVQAGGLPLNLLVRAAIRRAREARAAAAEPTVAVAPSASTAPAAAATAAPALVMLPVTLRGHSLAAVFVEISRLAGEAAIHREHMDGLAHGRTYGDPTLAGVEPAPCLVAQAALAASRADQVGAVADLLRALIGREGEIELVLTGGAGV